MEVFCFLSVEPLKFFFLLFFLFGDIDVVFSRRVFSHVRGFIPLLEERVVVILLRFMRM